MESVSDRDKESVTSHLMMAELSEDVVICTKS